MFGFWQMTLTLGGLQKRYKTPVPSPLSSVSEPCICKGHGAMCVLNLHVMQQRIW